MALSQRGLQAAMAQSTGEVFLQCLVFSSSVTDTLRLVSDHNDLIRQIDGRSRTFHRFLFAVQGPGKTPNRTPQLRIQCDVVDERVVVALRSLAGRTERIQMRYDVVLASEPDHPQYGPYTFEFEQFTISEDRRKGTIVASYLKGALNDQFPYTQFGPANVAA